MGAKNKLKVSFRESVESLVAISNRLSLIHPGPTHVRLRSKRLNWRLEGTYAEVNVLKYCGMTVWKDKHTSGHSQLMIFTI